jgi:DNA repair photolyase
VRLDHLVRTAYTPEFDGVRFHEVLAKSALNKVPTASDMRFGWTINQMRGCLHQRTYCFARPTHEFLDLDVGKDFDT